MTPATKAIAECDAVVLGDSVEPVVDGLCGEFKETFDLVGRRAASVEQPAVRRLAAFGSVSVRSCWRNCSSSTPASFVPYLVIPVSTRREDMN